MKRGACSKSWRVKTIADDRHEADETFYVSVSFRRGRYVVPAGYVISDGMAEVVIVTDDPAPPQPEGTEEVRVLEPRQSNPPPELPRLLDPVLVRAQELTQSWPGSVRTEDTVGVDQ
jgi:hypothetical protein